MRDITKDTALCISVAERPSNIGTRFHNYLYEKLDLDFVYKAFRPVDIAATIQGMRGLPIRGCSVSMPFKQAVIPLVDVVEPSAAAIDSVNTIVNDGGRLIAYNTDLEAVSTLIAEADLDPATPVVVRGSGGMARAVVGAFHTAGFAELTVLARSATQGADLAAQYGYSATTEEPAPTASILVNATPIGMNGPDADALAFPRESVEASAAVLDVVAFPSDTPLIRAAQESGRPVITGADVIALQAARQFQLYTGVTPSRELVLEASAYSRS